MSDDKRQPILLADANKQLRRENGELKARNQERLCENEVLRIENEEIRALAVDLRSKLIAIDHDPLQDICQPAIQLPWSSKHGSLDSSHSQISPEYRSSQNDASAIVRCPRFAHSEPVATSNVSLAI